MSRAAKRIAPPPRVASAGRRRLLLSLGAGALALAGCGRRGRSDPTARLAQVPAAKRIPSPPDKRRLAVLRDEGAISAGGEVDERRVGEMLNQGMLALTGAEAPAEAWSRYFRPGDVVAIKVNCLGGPGLRSHPELVEAIVRGVASSGVRRQDIIIYDRDTRELRECGFEVQTGGGGPLCYGTDEVGYDAEPTVVKSVGSLFSRIVSTQCNAIINVPVLKDHDLAGISGALKNHFGSIHNPNKLHTDHCSPYVADLNCAALLRDKQRLVVYDALKACYEGGPGYKPDTTIAFGGLMLGSDAVALDALAVKMLDAMREEHGLPALGTLERAPRYVAVAADEEHGLGTDDLGQVEILRPEEA
ncbi:MAG: DUF362 domain-containing protein [Armatimonadota bacterium]